MFSSSKKDLKNALAEFLAEPEGPTKKFQIFIYLIHCFWGWGFNLFCLTVEKLHKWPRTDAAGSLYVCG